MISPWLIAFGVVIAVAGSFGVWIVLRATSNSSWRSTTDWDRDSPPERANASHAILHESSPLAAATLQRFPEATSDSGSGTLCELIDDTPTPTQTNQAARKADAEVTEWPGVKDCASVIGNEAVHEESGGDDAGEQGPRHDENQPPDSAQTPPGGTFVYEPELASGELERPVALFNVEDSSLEPFAAPGAAANGITDVLGTDHSPPLTSGRYGSATTNPKCPSSHCPPVDNQGLIQVGAEEERGCDQHPIEHDTCARELGDKCISETECPVSTETTDERSPRRAPDTGIEAESQENITQSRPIVLGSEGRQVLDAAHADNDGNTLGEVQLTPSLLQDEADTLSETQQSEVQSPDAGVGAASASANAPKTPRSRSRSPKYQPTARTSGATRRISRQPPSPTEGARARSFGVAVHIVFGRGRRNQCQLSLLPSRTSNLPEAVSVNRPQGTEVWNACQDEWYNDLTPPSIETLLSQGASWDCLDDEEVRWVLSGREIWVLAQSPTGTVSGFVSVPRLILREGHLVLCTERQERAVRDALVEAGCAQPCEVRGNGVPSGWLMFQGVRPTTPIHHDDSAGIFNILRPVHDVEIVFHGGIRLSHATWLIGHPPQIRIRGIGQEVAVLIDERPALADGSGNYAAPDWDTPGLHTVFCGGVAESYELVDGCQHWDDFPAFVYRPSCAEFGARAFAICGPLVTPAKSGECTTLTPASNACLLGPAPGQVEISPQPYDVRPLEFLAVASFPVAWTIPTDPLHSNKSNASVRLLNSRGVEERLRESARPRREAILRWCQAILNASRKGLRVEPDTDQAKQLWAEYKRVARRLWKQLR